MIKLAQLYAYMYIAIQRYFGVNIPGLGFLLRQVKQPFYIRLLGQDMYFDPGAASSYGLHVVGVMQEPETHRFLNKAFDVVKGQPAWFVEVGANVGAFLLDIARRPNVNLLGFEPSLHCVNAIEQTMARNGRTNCRVFPQLVGDTTRQIAFDVGRHDGSASVLTSANTSIEVEQIRLDDSTAVSQIPSGSPTVLMIDVEGYEPSILTGGREFIQKIRPLIIFEYNFVSKRHFHLRDIQILLGADYRIYRLRKDGFLDQRTDNAWNCVAVPVGTLFEAFSSKLIKQCAD